MPLWQWVVDIVVVLLVVLVLYGLALVVRRRLLSREGGTFELSYRARSSRIGRGWVLGLGRYAGDELQWFRIFSLSPRPGRVWKRSGLSFEGRREPVGHEELALYAEHVIVVLREGQVDLELALGPASLVGFQSWLESAPPGTDWDRDRLR
ncbi:DUF2550 domain-containing protein [Nocardioides sp. Bht2]|uniref:DUF2550 domain-containing protein n=1 Tax=Nocardioides sp. Bht2 TaxID=3392297 RepID=UPI0039B4416A